MNLKKLHIYLTQIDFDLIDAGNVVYHPNYLVLCERARNAALGDAGYSFQEMWSEGYALAVVETQSRYSQALKVGEQVAILTCVTEACGSRVKVRQEIVLTSSLGEECKNSGFSNSDLGSLKRKASYELDLTLVCVRLNPIKAARLPQRLADILVDTSKP